MCSGKMNRPFLLSPSGKSYLWGGRRLENDFNKHLGMDVLAETWECSTHPDGPSLVASGEYSGMPLSELLVMHPEFVGTHPRHEGGLPILVKLIDAREDLSIQVHPDDEWAFENENGQMGKSEMWYVLDASPEARIVYGLSQDVSREVFLDSFYAGDVDKFFQRIPIVRDDVFFIKAGLIHSLCAGSLVVEIQESSNLTYRIYDYERVDRHGERRRLDIDKALAVADLSRQDPPRQPMRVIRYRPGYAEEFVGRCRYFEVHRFLMNLCDATMPYSSDSLSFRVLLCIDGGLSVAFEGEVLELCKGQTLFIPADSCPMEINGNGQVLEIRG